MAIRRLEANQMLSLDDKSVGPYERQTLETVEYVMNLASMIAVVMSDPGYAFMKGAGRFAPIRKAVSEVRGFSQRSRWSAFCDLQRSRLSESAFQNVDPDAFAKRLVADGVVAGLELPPEYLNKLQNIAKSSVCYADRDPALGFTLDKREEAEKKLGKPILLAQYFNMDAQSEVVAQLRNDPFMLLVAALYLGSLPTHISTNMWWTFAVDATEEDRIKHAHRYHNDLDDFAFLKFFFYLSDVEADDGAHICVAGSHRSPLIKKTSDYWQVRRYDDREVEESYGADRILAIAGQSGTGFAEDTLCIHKGTTPQRRSRLVIQFQYALFDYLKQHDNLDPSLLKRIA